MFDPEKAKAVIGFISGLTHVEGRQFAGKPFKSFMWQLRLLWKLFGTVKEDGFRQYRTAFIEIPKKNGKSEIGAAIALKLLCADGEKGAEVYSVASDKDQAGIIFRKAAQMVRNNEELDNRLKIVESQKRIIDYKTNSFYRVLSSEVKTKHGFNPHGVIFDELHTQPNRELWDVLTVGTDAARKQQLVFVMTTAGFGRHSICREVHDYALKVRDGIIEDPRFLPIIFGVPEDKNWEDEKEWIKANPSIEKIFTIDNLRAEYAEAKAIPSRENEFRRLRLNQWTEQETRWIPIDRWDLCKGKVSKDGLKGQTCYLGMDLSSTFDVAALCLVFPPNGDGRYDTVFRFFIPEENMKQRVKRDRVPYDVWAKKRLIQPTPGNVVDYDVIKHEILELGKEYDLKEVAYDPWGATKLVQELQDEGVTVVPIRQGFASLAAPTRELEKIILSKQLRHDGNPIMRWMMSNVVVKQDPVGNIKPDKSKSTEKIDGIVALIMALDRATRQGNQKSIYEDRGLLILDDSESKETESEEETEKAEGSIEKHNFCVRCNSTINLNMEFCPSCGMRIKINGNRVMVQA